MVWEPNPDTSSLAKTSHSSALKTVEGAFTVAFLLKVLSFAKSATACPGVSEDAPKRSINSPFLNSPTGSLPLKFITSLLTIASPV